VNQTGGDSIVSDLLGFDGKKIERKKVRGAIAGQKTSRGGFNGLRVKNEKNFLFESKGGDFNPKGV